jgi:methylated-DNA-[protein]-cysteine S-methyltransferase
MDNFSVVYKTCIKSKPYGPINILWRYVNGKPKVIRILLPKSGDNKLTLPPKIYTNIQELSCDFIDNIADMIVAFLDGEPINFPLENVDLSKCSEFQRNVLYAEYNIPRGRVSTYRLIAMHLGIKNGARAVGNALAKNPVPLIIPCHRAIRSNLHIGGYQGGVKMKRDLLEKEGINFDKTGRVVCDTLYYD